MKESTMDRITMFSYWAFAACGALVALLLPWADPRNAGLLPGGNLRHVTLLAFGGCGASFVVCAAATFGKFFFYASGSPFLPKPAPDPESYHQ